jgi:hypothetical protein
MPRHLEWMIDLRIEAWDVWAQLFEWLECRRSVLWPSNPGLGALCSKQLFDIVAG